MQIKSLASASLHSVGSHVWRTAYASLFVGDSHRRQRRKKKQTNVYAHPTFYGLDVCITGERKGRPNGYVYVLDGPYVTPSPSCV